MKLNMNLYISYYQVVKLFSPNTFFAIFWGICLFMLNGHSLKAQVQWANEVLSVSSEASLELSRHQYRAEQVLGKPNILPQTGLLHPCSWVPEKTDHQAKIMVGYENPMKIQQVAIAQSFFGGAISKVWLMDKKNQFYLVYDAPPKLPRNPGGMLWLLFKEQTKFKVQAIKIQMDGSDGYGLTCIDAIGISKTTERIQPRINLAKTPSEDTTKAHLQTVFIENMGNAINSEYEEILPVISPDGKRLYFDRKNHPNNILDRNQQRNDDIWFADLQENGKFSEAIRMPKPLNNTSHNYVCSVSPDGNTLLLGNKYIGETCVAGISISHQIEKDGKESWSFPEEILIDNYYNLNKFGEFCLAHNQKVLLLAIERHDSKGDRDLYVTFRKPDNTTDKNKWTKPLNLGDKINSAASEITPFLAADGKTLYFSSNGFSGYGDADMFMTRRLDDSWTNWTEPINLGLEFNTKEWDASYSIDAAGEYAYFVSYSNSKSKSADIFRAKLPQPIKPDPVVLIYGKVLNSKTKKPISAKIFYETLPEGKEIGTATSNPETGDYKIVLPLNKKYGFWANAGGYLSENENINLMDSSGYVELQRDLYLTPIEIGKYIRLNNIFFAQNKAELIPESFPELNRVAKMLQENPKMTIEIAGHTDLGGNPDKMFKLSDKRVKTVKRYLEEKNITSGRIQVKAYGLTQPLFKTKNAKNRRVEFKILSY